MGLLDKLLGRTKKAEPAQPSSTEEQAWTPAAPAPEEPAAEPEGTSESTETTPPA